MSPTPITSTAMDMAKKLLTTTASLATTALLARTLLNDYIPDQFRDHVSTLLSSLFSSTSHLTIVIAENEGVASNHIYHSAALYLGGMVSSRTRRLRVSKQENQSNAVVTVDKGEEVVDVFEGVEFKWRLESRAAPAARGERRRDGDDVAELRFFELGFHRRHRDMAIKRYLPFVVEKANAIREADKPIKLHMLRYDEWNPVNLDHPATFDTVALDPDLRKMVMSDLASFVKRKDYYRKVGKAWKRGYLLYGPPGTGKSSLIAAMANFLKYDIYDLELAEVGDNSALRALLVATANRSIIVVEDIDCTIDLKNREGDGNKEKISDKAQRSNDENQNRVTLSGVLNAIDGLWSSCGDERIIVFTTNHRERLDPALLRPGRMDVHVHMSYCTPPVFRVLASNYHSVDDHVAFPEIERLVTELEVTPAEVAGELMKSDDVDVALGSLATLLREKKRRREVEGGVDVDGENAKRRKKEEQSDTRVLS